MKGCPDQK